MARIKITLPEKFIYSTKIPIRIGDINRGGHLGHESFLVIMEEARERFLQSLGYLFGTGGVGFVMTDVAVMYLRQGSYGQILEVRIGVSDITAKGFDMVYQVADAETGLELARAKTGVLFYDYSKKRTASIPPGLRGKLSGQEQF